MSQHHAFAEDKQNTIAVAESQMAGRRIASTAQVTAKPSDQGDRFAQIFRWF